MLFNHLPLIPLSVNGSGDDTFQIELLSSRREWSETIPIFSHCKPKGGQGVRF